MCGRHGVSIWSGDGVSICSRHGVSIWSGDGVMEDMVSDGTTIKYHLWNEVYYRNDMWSGAEQNDRRGISISKLKREIGEKKKKMVLLVFACFAR